LAVASLSDMPQAGPADFRYLSIFGLLASASLHRQAKCCQCGKSAGREVDMRATVGDRLHVHGNTVGERDRMGEIVEVRGPDGGPPYVVRYEDGHEGLVFPGPDAVVEPKSSTTASSTDQVG
jgi:hypothetical protein